MKAINQQLAPATTLDELKAQFTHWRQTRSKMTPIPNDLWEQVFLLVDHYRTSQVLGALGISRVQFRKAQSKHNPAEIQLIDSPFMDISKKVVATDLTAMISTDDNTITVEYKRKDGVSLNIKGLPIVRLDHIIHSFYGNR